MWRSVVVLAIVGAILLPQRASATLLVQQVNLRLSDLPAGYIQISDETTSNAKAAKAEGFTVAQENQRGRLISGGVTFLLLGTHAASVDSLVEQFRTNAQALVAYQRSVHLARHVRGLTELSVPAVGVVHIGLEYSDSTQKKGLAIVFVRDGCVVLISIYGQPTPALVRLLIHAAQIVDSRLVAATH